MQGVGCVHLWKTVSLDYYRGWCFNVDEDEGGWGKGDERQLDWGRTLPHVLGRFQHGSFLGAWACEVGVYLFIIISADLRSILSPTVCLQTKELL